VAHALLLELFTEAGVWTMIIPDGGGASTEGTVPS
jgi:hypothetical protein